VFSALPNQVAFINRKQLLSLLLSTFSSGKAVYEFNVLLSDSTSPATVAGNQIWLPGWLEATNSGKMIYS
jgi:hypothetical protein